MVKDCKNIKDLFSLYIDGDLSDVEMSEIESHLNGCKSCEKELTALSKTVQLVKSLPKFTAPTSMLSNVKREIKARRNIFQRIYPAVKWTAGGLALAATVFFIVKMNGTTNISSVITEKLSKTSADKKAPSPVAVGKNYRPSGSKEKARKEVAESISAKAAAPSALKQQDDSSKLRSEGMKLEEQEKAKSVSVLKDSADADKQRISLKGAPETAGFFGSTNDAAVKPTEESEVVENGALFKREIGATKSIKKDKLISPIKDSGILHKDHKKKNMVIRSENEWQSFCSQVFSGKQTPEVDFGKDMLVAVFAGEKNSSGYTVEITSTGTENGKFVVKYKESGSGGPLTVMTYPYSIRSVARSDLPVEFVKE